ncbi:MAG: NUDIX hydrolase [Gammaproteobacteria bacterium]|nr:NUDIX hydrolase [Gammaproteobacteria bacterium]
MKFCSSCGSPVSQQIPEGDSRLRFVCGGCSTIHYQNPRIIAGCIVEHNQQILLCKRAIEPRKGYWTLPAGFMENGETIEAGAVRETWEEALAKVSDPQLYTLFNLPHISQVYVFYRGALQSGAFGVGEETLESRLFPESEIPWDELAFPTVHKTLKHFFRDTKNNDFPIRIEDITFPRK